MKTQSEFYNLETGRSYFEQYFTTISNLPLKTNEYFLLKDFLENAIHCLIDGKKIELRIIINENESNTENKKAITDN
jgi:hypothetical protein